MGVSMHGSGCSTDWNALPDAVVTDSINQFKGRLGRWWKNDPILYQHNYRSPQVTKHSAIAIYNAREGHQPCCSKPFNGESTWRSLTQNFQRIHTTHTHTGRPDGHPNAITCHKLIQLYIRYSMDSALCRRDHAKY